MPTIKKILTDDQKHQVNKTPAQQGEESVSGETPDPESDDNVLDKAHKMGIYEKADEEHPQELGLGEEVNKEEEERLGED